MDLSEEKRHSEYSHDRHCEHALGNFLADLVWEVFGVLEEGFVVDCVVEQGAAEEVHEDAEEPVHLISSRLVTIDLLMGFRGG